MAESNQSPSNASDHPAMDAFRAIAQAQRAALLAHERAAASIQKEMARLDQASTEIHERIAEAQNSLVLIETAKARARREAEQLKGQALDLRLQSAMSLIGLVPETEKIHFSEAVQFAQFDLAATRMFAKGAEKQWKVGDAFELRPEPENPKDANAVLILVAGVKVGYISADDAAKLKKMNAHEGWRIAGVGYLASKSGGKFNEGTLRARLISPLMGWSGFNPSKNLAENLAAMEKQLLAATAMQPSEPVSVRKIKTL